MPIQIVRNDITKMSVDAIVNAAKPSLLGGGGVDGAIHRAAGPELLEECRTLGGCLTGQAKITKGYRLPARYVIHTVGPVWNDGQHGEPEALASCYRSSLQLAKAHGLRSVAFPLISAGVYGYPKEKAIRVAMEAITAFLMDSDDSGDMLVYLVVYSRESVQLGSRLSAGIREYIDDHYVEEHPYHRDRRRRENRWFNEPTFSIETESAAEEQPDMLSVPIGAAKPAEDHVQSPRDAIVPDDWLDVLDESFQQMLFRKIDEKGMTDAQCYKKANIDRKLFSKIRGDVHYQPSKKTAVALAVALELPLDETKDLLMKAGFALSRSNLFDVIVEYFISQNNYNIFEINEALFSYDQITLG